MPVGPIGLVDNLFFPALLHPSVNFNTATSLLSTDSISTGGVPLADARHVSMGSCQIKAPSTPMASPSAVFPFLPLYAYRHKELSLRKQCCSRPEFFQGKGGDTEFGAWRKRINFKKEETP